jgi:hypothetical protein
MGYLRDPEFWFKKGDCVVIVENTMLKVSTTCWSFSTAFVISNSQIYRSDLERDCSVFADMFSLPNGDDSPNATTEADPLILPDKIHEFRALCWVLYAK